MTLGSVDLREIPGVGVGRLVQAITVASAGTNAEVDVELNCLTQQIHFTVPDLDNTDTAELKLLDADDKVIYPSGEKAEQLTHVINVARALTHRTTLRIECSGAQAAGRVFEVRIYYV